MSGRDTHTNTRRVAEEVLGQKQSFPRSKTGPQSRELLSSLTLEGCVVERIMPPKDVYTLISKPVNVLHSVVKGTLKV